MTAEQAMSVRERMLKKLERLRGYIAVASVIHGDPVLVSMCSEQIDHVEKLIAACEEVLEF